MLFSAPAGQKREKLNNYTRRLQSDGEGGPSSLKVQVVDYRLFFSSGEKHRDFVHDVIIKRCIFESMVVANVANSSVFQVCLHLQLN